MADVQLPKNQAPIFPDVCIDCRKPEPGNRVTLWTSWISWWILLTIIAIFWAKTAKATVPMCKPCAWRFRFRRLGYAAYLAAASAIIIVGVPHLFPHVPRLINKGIMVVAFVILMLPYLVWYNRKRPCIELTIEGDQVTYQFRDWAIADEFAALNVRQE